MKKKLFKNVWYFMLFLSVILISKTCFADTPYYLFATSSYIDTISTSTATSTIPTFDTAWATTTKLSRPNAASLCVDSGKRLPTLTELFNEQKSIGTTTWVSRYGATAASTTWSNQLTNYCTGGCTAYYGYGVYAYSTFQYHLISNFFSSLNTAYVLCVSDNPVTVLDSYTLATSSSFVNIASTSNSTSTMDLASTTEAINNGSTLTNFFLLLIFIIIFIMFFYNTFFGIKQRPKKYD